MTRFFQVEGDTVMEVTEPRDFDGSEIELTGDQFIFALGTGLGPRIVINDWFGPQPLLGRVRLVAAAADAMWEAM